MQIETPQAVAIYCRLSKEDLDENKIDNLSRSIQNQKSMLTDFAEINGWQIFDIYCDDNLSGVARDRPEFNRLIRDIAGNLESNPGTTRCRSAFFYTIGGNRPLFPKSLLWPLQQIDENRKVKKKIWYVLQLRNMRQKAP